MSDALRSLRLRDPFLATVGLLLCSGCEFGGRQESPSPPEDIPILWRASGTYSHLTKRIRVAVRDPAALAQLPLTEIPVDFETQMVLVAGLGPTVSDELGLRINRVWREGSKIRVEECRIHPGPEPKAGANPASPWTVAIIPRSDLNVEGYTDMVPKGAVSGTTGISPPSIPGRRAPGR